MLKINAEIVIEINERYFNTGILNKSLILSAFSSYHYYEGHLEQFASVFLSLVKNHGFNDANKRTATLCFLYEFDEYVLSDDDVFNFAVSVAANNYSVLKVSKMINKIIKIKN